MPQVETFFILMAAVTALVLLARRLEQPYPILLVLGGLLIGFTPGLPNVRLHSEIVFLIFLPPLLFYDALHTSWRDFRHNLRPILMLAIVLVLATMAAVAVVSHALIPHLSWPAAFMLGAVVAPTDAVATGAIAERLHLPNRIVTILQGESLVNDATALVSFRIALAVALGSAFSPAGAVGSFLLVSAGGIAVGLAIGWVVGWIRHSLPQDPPVENTVSLLTPFAAYLPAETLHVSGVLAVVVCGIYLGRMSPRALSAQTRLQASAMWDMMAFLLNGLLFLLVGMQLPEIVRDFRETHVLKMLAFHAFLIGLAVIATRIALVYLSIYLTRLIPALRRDDPFPSWRRPTIVAWSGLRGGVSLATALAIPLSLGDASDAAPFPIRHAILFVTFIVILMTLVGQGLTLPPLIRALSVSDDSEERSDELKARHRTAAAAIERLESLTGAEGIPEDVHREIRNGFERRSRHLQTRLDILSGEARDDSEPAPDSDEIAAEQLVADGYLRLKRETLEAERAALMALRDSGDIGDSTLRLLQRELDLEEERLRLLSAIT